MDCIFTILGEPKGKGRPRFTKSGRTYTPETTATYQNLVKLEYQRQCGDMFFEQGIPVRMLIHSFYSIPKSATKKKATAMRNKNILPTKKPDCDNVGKIIADSLNGIAYHDDSQITDMQIIKEYSDKPRVEVLIINLEKE